MDQPHASGWGHSPSFGPKTISYGYQMFGMSLIFPVTLVANAAFLACLISLLLRGLGMERPSRTVCVVLGRTSLACAILGTVPTVTDSYPMLGCFVWLLAIAATRATAGRLPGGPGVKQGLRSTRSSAMGILAAALLVLQVLGVLILLLATERGRTLWRMASAAMAG